MPSEAAATRPRWRTASSDGCTRRLRKAGAWVKRRRSGAPRRCRRRDSPSEQVDDGRDTEPAGLVQACTGDAARRRAARRRARRDQADPPRAGPPIVACDPDAGPDGHRRRRGHDHRRAQFDLVIASRESLKIRPQIEHAFRGKGVQYQLWASSPNELRYEVSVPFDQDIKKLAKIIKRLDGRDASVEWEIKKYKTVRT